MEKLNYHYKKDVVYLPNVFISRGKMTISLSIFILLIELLILIISLPLSVLGVNEIVAITIFNIVLIGYREYVTDGRRLTFSSALLLYIIATEFGLVLPYKLVGESVVSDYSPWVIRFLHSEQLLKGLVLGNLAIISFEIGKYISRRKKPLKEKTQQDNRLGDTNIQKKLNFVANVSLFTVLFFFCYHILSGGMYLFSTYDVYRTSSAYNSPIYDFILVLFYVGTIYMAAAGSIRKNLLGWGIWLLIVAIFALNGNKGEFLYSLLAVLGMKGVEGSKINRRQIIVIIVIVFLVIPTITSLRNIGVVENLSQLSFKPFDAFVEMGMQMRINVEVLDAYEVNKIEPLYGRSYIQPIVNIFTPFLEHEYATTQIREMFPGMGFTQVIESYLNFGIFGVIFFHFLIGYFVSFKEAIVKSRYELAYVGTITCILINATRNYFAFVIGQILIVTSIYIIVRKLR